MREHYTYFGAGTLLIALTLCFVMVVGNQTSHSATLTAERSALRARLQPLEAKRRAALAAMHAATWCLGEGSREAEPAQRIDVPPVAYLTVCEEAERSRLRVRLAELEGR